MNRKQRLINEIAFRVADVLLNEANQPLHQLQNLYKSLENALNRIREEVSENVNSIIMSKPNALREPNTKDITEDLRGGFITLSEWIKMIRNATRNSSILSIADSAEHDAASKWRTVFNRMQALVDMNTDPTSEAVRGVFAELVGSEADISDWIDEWMYKVGVALGLRTEAEW